MPNDPGAPAARLPPRWARGTHPKEATVSDAAHNPTAVRRELGQRLRALRQGRELTAAQAAERVGFSSSRVTKIELAQLRVSQKDGWGCSRRTGD